MKRAVLLVALLATAAHADVWQRAIDTTDATRDQYQLALGHADDLVTRANARSASRAEILRLVDTAIRFYQEAAALRPNEAEPYFRIASVVDSFFVDCDGMRGARPLTCPPGGGLDPARGKQSLDAWEQFEKRAPLDPRITENLFSRAILRTKLVDSAKDPKPLLQGALRDYTAMLERWDGLSNVRQEGVWGNLAETYMMLGRVEEAIDAYRVALDKGAGTSTAYGLAVALDRDDQGPAALDLIKRQGPRAFLEFKQEVAIQNVFFVPEGEVYYYFALANEAFGYLDQAIAHWRLYMKSGAHPQFHARAKAHLEALALQKKQNPAPTRPPDDFDLLP